MVHASRDLLVQRNGSIKHSVIINTEVECDINMFAYPFVGDACPVAIEAWAQNGRPTFPYINPFNSIRGSICVILYFVLVV